MAIGRFFPKVKIIIGLLITAIISLIFVNLYLAKFGLPKRKAGSCLILEERYCKKIKLIPDPAQEKGLLAVVKVPKGTVVFSPANGTLSTTPIFVFPNGPEKRYPGVVINERDGDEGLIKTIYGLTFFKEGDIQSSSIIEKGQVISRISKNTLDIFGDYNLVFSIFKVPDDANNASATINDSSLLEEIIGNKTE